MAGSVVSKPTPLGAVNAVTILASVGTGVVWNGVPFIAKHEYGFSEERTLLLYVVLGATYVAGAISTGPVLRLIERRLSPRAVLAWILLLEAAVCVSLIGTRSPWHLVAVSCGISVLSSWLWPIIESYLTAGRHGAAMRAAIGWWNLCWTGAVAAALVLMMPMMRNEPFVLRFGAGSLSLEPRLAIVVLGMTHALAIVPLFLFGRRPVLHDRELSHAAIQPEYGRLLRSARVLLPLSYVLNSAMAPLLPYLFERVYVAKEEQTLVASTWMWVRIGAMAIMWRAPFWHGLWGTLLLGGLLLAAGFGMVVAAVSLPMAIGGLGLFGAGMGVVYYAALYYAMSVGHAEVDAGGTHEALIGVGYAVGPLAGLAGTALGSRAAALGIAGSEGAGVVAVVLLLFGIGTVGAWRPYAAARRARHGG